MCYIGSIVKYTGKRENTMTVNDIWHGRTWKHLFTGNEEEASS